ncbi:disintegrin and metalloproteinase domain-containing protein 20 [Dasypus novemcinctus]|uniref:disintegrin and metalloproteinase domain-containing protein 20 n=1 Tax=Dasypus novemcinctus TaxID=9361 RepID=UPI00265F5225|nr:disintegrin and metalloproteinase domain-containing protein 20 [Dasypus novemcinctus]XP_058163201.1 disintegrin and metalloproteinase domain-containing protein 20 [Dasypus novemcinctus]
MAAGKALVRIRITLLLPWLEGFLFLSGWSLDEPSQHDNPPEVVIPLRLSGTGKRVEASGWLSYSLRFGGQRHIVHMKVKKSFLARNLPVFTYTEQGALHEEQPFIQNDCYYHGYVEGDSESLVVLSSCFGGFQGILQIKDITYEIRPKSFSDTFEHLVYKMDSEETQFPPLRCGLKEEEIERQLEFQGIGNYTLRQSDYQGWWTHKTTLELAFVVDNKRYETLESNESLVQGEIFDVLNLMDTFYKPMDVDIVLCALEIWTEGNLIPIEKIGAVLDAFCKWNHNNLAHRASHDVASFVADKNFAQLGGLAFIGTVCSKINCAVLSFIGRKLSEFAVITGHEIGHVLGMKHDENTCNCGHRYCIMYPSVSPSNRFSNCSYAYFWSTIRRKSCLRNAPNRKNLRVQARCGNHVVEEGEQCDCGSLKSCTEDPCCLSNCTLRAGAACAFGLCCHNCRILSAGKLCRAEVNECDLPEWCNGSSHHCPEDVYVREGTPCPKGGYCFEKRCNIRDEQCKKIFGQGARSANQSCYENINTKGDRFGHCGIRNNEYERCNLNDILCGRVQCENVSLIPLLESHNTVLRTPLQGVICWGIDYHFGMTIPDIGDVKDGTECGPDNICVNRKCVPVSTLESGCTNKTCNNSGVCNNKQHCHCNYGWAPPNCQTKGTGGSVDSGPPSVKIRNHKHRVAYLLLSLIPLLALLSWCLILLCMRKREEKNLEEGSAPPPPPPAPPSKEKPAATKNEAKT